MSKLPYWTCPACGANLDHGERCDCKNSLDLAANTCSVCGEVYNFNPSQGDSGMCLPCWQEMLTEEGY